MTPCLCCAAVEQVAILADGLRDGRLQQSLAQFCKVELHAPVARAALLQVDRRGLTILGEQASLSIPVAQVRFFQVFRLTVCSFLW